MATFNTQDEADNVGLTFDYVVNNKYGPHTSQKEKANLGVTVSIKMYRVVNSAIDTEQ